MTALASPTRLLYRVSRAGLKALRSHLRAAAGGAVARDLPTRLALCQLCPLCTSHKGKTYCGKPFLTQIAREESTQGCGCPVVEKARDPQEHCPRTRRFEKPVRTGNECDCHWCSGAAARSEAQLAQMSA